MDHLDLSLSADRTSPSDSRSTVRFCAAGQAVSSREARRGGRSCGAVEQEPQLGPVATECRTIMDRSDAGIAAQESAPWKQQLEAAQCCMARWSAPAWFAKPADVGRNRMRATGIRSGYCVVRAVIGGSRRGKGMPWVKQNDKRQQKRQSRYLEQRLPTRSRRTIRHETGVVLQPADYKSDGRDLRVPGGCVPIAVLMSTAPYRRDPRGWGIPGGRRRGSGPRDRSGCGASLRVRQLCARCAPGDRGRSA